MVSNKLYRYQKFSALSLDALCHDQLYFSDPSAFNDPLDCNPSVENDCDRNTLRSVLSSLIRKRLEQEMLASLKKANIDDESGKIHAENQALQEAEIELNNIAYHATNPEYECSKEEAECWLLTNEIQSELLKHNNRGVCCLSEEYDNPLLWSHYADQHNGFCVGYSLNRNPKPMIQKVLYGGQRTIKTSIIAQAVLNNDANARKELGDNVWLRKALPWKYEKEWRLLDSEGLQDSPLLLKEITFGLRCPSAVMHAVIAALNPRDIKFYKIYEDRGNFKLKRSNKYIEEICTQYPRTSRSGIEVFGPVINS